MRHYSVAMIYRVDIASDRYAPLPPLDDIPEVEADTPMEAVRLALLKSTSPLIGREGIWARVVVGTHPNGDVQVMSISLAREIAIPLDWTDPGDVR